jgi:hypothetical protein
MFKILLQSELELGLHNLFLRTQLRTEPCNQLDSESDHATSQPTNQPRAETRTRMRILMWFVFRQAISTFFQKMNEAKCTF